MKKITLSDAEDAYNADDNETALKGSRKLAEQGDMDAQILLGWMYKRGEGVTQDFKEAFKWYSLAAEQGDAAAMAVVSFFYEATARFNWNIEQISSMSIEERKAIGLKWRRLAAEKGDAISQCRLGWNYANGEGVAQDDKEAAKWYRLSAEQGDRNAQYRLGVMYEKGRGVTQDYKKAVKCYRAAAMRGLHEGHLGHPDAQFNLYLCYRDGLGVEKDLEKANYWHNKATERDNVAAFKYFEDQKNVFNFHYWKIQ